jgi:polygalacturonase
MAGEAALPELPATAGNLRSAFGAVGDGVTDDTAALQAAIDSVEDQGVIYIPNGVYVISKKFDIAKRIVLKGGLRGGQHALEAVLGKV